MIRRAMAFVCGLGGATALSQYPEFSQQYTQHLAGQIEALSGVVADFDASAERSGLSRDEALAQMVGTDFLQDRQGDMVRTFARFDGLTADFRALSAATPLERLAMPHRLADAQTLKGTWENYTPAMPLTLAGAVSALAGFAIGWGGVGGVLALMSRPFRRHRQRGRTNRGDATRREPPLTRVPGE